MKFTDQLRQAADPVWERWHQHPFVKGIGDGTLELEKFKYWLRQDYVYLKDYARIFALGAAKGDTLETMSVFANLLDGTLNVEMGLHRKYCAKFGINEKEIEKETPSPTTQAYTDFMLARSYEGDLADLMAALLPCTWGFWEIANRLIEKGAKKEGNPYWDWIEMYTSEEFSDFAKWAIDLMDRLGEGLPEARKQRLTEIFVTSSKYEYLFWEMAENLEQWPV